jgi:HK97 family phage major capsid protein
MSVPTHRCAFFLRLNKNGGEENMEKRSFEIDVGGIRAESRTVPASLSSELPVKRFDGDEVLSHKPGAVDLSRAPLPLLRAHDNAALPVGVVEDLKLEGGRLKGTIRLSSNQDGIWKDICDGILRSLSIGYQIIEKRKTKGGFIATKWMPYECSLVAAPADNTVGINRSITEKKGAIKMDKNDLLKTKKAAVDELAELAKTGDDAERMEALKGELRALDARLEAMDIAEAASQPRCSRKYDWPSGIEIKQDRSIIEITGGPVTDRSYAGMFNQGRKFEADAEEMRAFRDAFVSGLPSSGGFAVPESLSAQWLDDALPLEIVRPRATVWTMESATRKVAGWDGANQSSTFHGGLAMEFIAEAAPATKQVGKLRAIELAAKKGAIFVDVSSELIDDGAGFDAQLELAMKRSLSQGIDYNLLCGAGGGAPLGVINSPGVITVAKETGQTKQTIIWENLCKMFARMYAPGQQRAVWVANSSAIPQLLSLSIAIGTGGSHIPAMTESNGEFKLLGRPVLFTPNLPALGTASDIIFVDLSQYAMGLRKSIRLERSNIPGWTNDLVSYRAIVRFDGQGTWSAAITPRNGDSLSWCVSLAARTS